MAETTDQSQQIEELKRRLQESEETLDAIRSGGVDALVVSGSAGEQVFTLKGADETYRTIVETMSEGSAVLDQDGTILYANRQLSALLHVPLSRLIGSPFSGLVQQTGAQPLDPFLRGPCGKAEFLLAGDGGRTVPVLLSASPLVTDGMEATCLVITDLSERKLAEEELQKAHDSLEVKVEQRTRALKDSEERYRTTVASIGDAVVTTDEKGSITFLNPIAERLTGWSNEEVAGKPLAQVFTIINEQTLEAVENPVYRVLREGRIVGLANHTSLVSRDGRQIPIEDSAAPIRDGEGKTTGAVMVFQDVTARRQAEAVLRRQAALIDLTPDATLVWHPDGAVTFISRGAEALYGWKKSEAIGQHIHRLLQTRFPEPIERIQDVLKQTGQWSGEVTHVTKDGRVIIVHSRWLAEFDDQGEVVDILESNIDITERKQMEEELRTSRDELDLRVHERTEELGRAYEKLKQETEVREMVEVQLRQAQKMEALGVLTGGIAHDFNNILAAVVGFSELTLDHLAEGSRDKRHVQRIFQAGLRGRELIKQMLAFSRKTEQDKKPLQWSGIVEETIKFLRASIPTTISIKTDIISESGLIFADSTQMQQVLMNLCTNAAHAMQARGGNLLVELSDFAVSESSENPHGIEPGLYMRLTVRDTGIGISPDVIDKIFDPFFTTKAVGEGTGLGLSVVHGIVKQHDGYITVESEQGLGSAFTVYLPMFAEEPSKDTDIADRPIVGGKERVLFVDDEEVLAEMGQEMLEGLGYHVTVQTSSAQALALFRSDPSKFDLVLTDQTMPEMTGVQLAGEIFAIRPDMPIIMYTGFSHLVDAGKAKAAGIRAFAMKPLTKREIARTIRKVLDEPTAA